MNTDTSRAALAAATAKRRVPAGTLRQNNRGYWRRKVEVEPGRFAWLFEHELIAEDKLGRRLGLHEQAYFRDGDHTNVARENIGIRGPITPSPAITFTAPTDGTYEFMLLEDPSRPWVGTWLSPPGYEWATTGTVSNPSVQPTKPAPVKPRRTRKPARRVVVYPGDELGDWIDKRAADRGMTPALYLRHLASLERMQELLRARID